MISIGIRNRLVEDAKRFSREVLIEALHKAVLGGTEDPKTLDACEETPWLRLEEVEYSLVVRDLGFI